ncbi:MAG TPA: hypothetical protein VJY35_00250 [Candidatus Eisenbacteria bacterium]|nr:hypothetical protein [Candidatus Eisenbacteria bacterium]
MRPRIALSAAGLAAVALLTLAATASAGPWGLSRGEWFASVEGSTFTANTYHLDDGSRVDLGSLIVESRALALSGEFGWKRHMTLAFRLPAMSVTERFGQFQATSTGFQNVGLGLRYNLKNAASALAVELDWEAPAGYNRRLSTLGDGLQTLTLNAAAGGGLMGRGFLQGSIGYAYRYLGIGKRDKGPVPAGETHTAKFTWADRVVASADLGYWAGPSLLVGGRYRGSLTVANGPFAAETDVHLVGPVLLYRVDDRIDMFAGSWTTAKGTNTLHYDQIYAGVSFHNTKLNRLQGFLGGKQSP